MKNYLIKELEDLSMELRCYGVNVNNVIYYAEKIAEEVDTNLENYEGEIISCCYLQDELEEAMKENGLGAVKRMIENIKDADCDYFFKDYDEKVRNLTKEDIEETIEELIKKVESYEFFESYEDYESY